MNIIENHNQDILNNLIQLYETNSISNIIFHGTNLTGKKTLLENFLKKIYLTQENFNKYVLTINCSHGKGNIKFIRENLKYFANSIILNNENTSLFKSIILLNADKLTVDAQSALRRSIEIYNHSTRFFIVVEDKSKLLKLELNLIVALNKLYAAAAKHHQSFRFKLSLISQHALKSTCIFQFQLK